MIRLATYLVLSLAAVLLLGAQSAWAALTYEQEVMADNPWTYYRFNETSGTTAADTASGIAARAGTYTGGVGMTATSPFGGALGAAKNFNGSSAYVDVPNLGGPSNTQFSIETWIKPSGYPGGLHALYAKDGWSSGGLHANFTGSSLEMAVNGNTSPWPTQNLGTALPAGSWGHLVVTYDLPASEVKFYANGQLVGTKATSGSTGVVFGPAALASWDTTGSGTTTRFLGADLDEFAIYQNTVLGADRVAAHYNAAIDPGQLQLVETGGPFSAGNMAAASSGATAFTKNEAAAGMTGRLNNGTFGNSSSWFGTADQSFAGIVFGAQETIDHIAFGRSNTADFGDRSLGNYTIQYTTAASPGASTPDSDWVTLGTLAYDNSSPASPGLRHLYSFPAVDATGVRILTDHNEFLQPPPHYIAIDEIEAYNGHPLTLIETGGTFGTDPVHPNLALRPGATPFAPDSFGSPHSIAGLNDGAYGNDNSWIGTDPDNTFAGIALGGMFLVDRVAWGRDNGGEATVFNDRTDGTYTLQFTQVANPDETTLDDDWTTIGSLFYTDFYQDYSRHLYEFDTVGATGFRLVLDATRQDRQIAIDEFEIYQAVPEPSAFAIWAIALAGLAWYGRRRRK
ncbi:MAG: hypothetical protein HQ581_16185 [Planctomycetes bacterium]|nr:hypothetical protein [Planctomycetota bacterium]